MTVQTVNPSVAPRLLPPQTMPRPPQMTIRSSQMQGSQQNQQQSQQGQQKPPPMAQPPQLTQAQFQSQNVPELVTIDSDTPSPIEQLEQKEEAETADMPVLDRRRSLHFQYFKVLFQKMNMILRSLLSLRNLTTSHLSVDVNS